MTLPYKIDPVQEFPGNNPFYTFIHLTPSFLGQIHVEFPIRKIVFSFCPFS